jgi:hypothetical protein
LLILTCFPTIPSQSLGFGKEKSLIERSRDKGNGTIIEMNVIQIKEDGTYLKIVKELTIGERQELMDKLLNAETLGETPREIFGEKLNILKNYGLVSNDLELEDLIPIEGLGEPLPIVDGQNFQADLAPLFIGGIGFGVGFGVPFLITAGTFFVAVAGAGLVLCLDFLEGVLYKLQTFLFPVLLGYLGGFTGLLMFGVLPGLFYSNFVALGIVAVTAFYQILGGGY